MTFNTPTVSDADRVVVGMGAVGAGLISHQSGPNSTILANRPLF